jgi:hypothetical protein
METFSASRQRNRRVLTQHLGLTFFDLGASFLGIVGYVFRWRKERSSISRVLIRQTLGTFASISGCFDAVKADFMSTVGTHQIVILSLAVIATLASLHFDLLLSNSNLLIKILNNKIYFKHLLLILNRSAKHLCYLSQ